MENDSFDALGLDPLGPNLHTLVAHAEGSHAMYFEPEDGRNPDVGCLYQDLSNRLRATTYALNFRDRTADSVRMLLTTVSGNEAERVLGFPAYWAPGEEYVLETPFRDWKQPRGTPTLPQGPKAPSANAVFRDPVLTIFCTEAWNYGGPGRAPRASCS